MSFDKIWIQANGQDNNWLERYAASWDPWLLEMEAAVAALRKRCGASNAEEVPGQ